MAGPLVVLFILLLVAAAFAPLIPMRRRRAAGFDGFPYITALLVFLNVVFFVASLNGTGHLSSPIVHQWGLTPRNGTFITLVTHMFLHGSWLHLIGNMIFLWLFGPHVEEALGRIEYLLFYIGGGIAAGLLHLLIADTLMTNAQYVPLVGASGAISAVLGLFAVRFWRARVRVLLLFTIPAIWAVGVFAAWQVFQAILSVANTDSSDGTANWAHVGGFLFGMLIAIPFQMRKDSQLEYDLEDAEKAAKAGQLDRAAAHYRSVLEQTPDDADAQHALGRVCIQMRQGEAAYRHLMDALQLYLRNNNPIAASRVYADALESFEVFPLPPALLQRVASACEDAGQYQLAMRALSELCRDHPEAREAEMGMIRLGKLHLNKLNQPQNAVGIFSEFIRTYPESEWAQHALRLREEAHQASLAFPFNATST